MNKNISDFKYCYGCGVCSLACHKKAISIKLNNGFLVPDVDETACNGCGICLMVCPFNHPQPFIKQKPLKSFAAFSNNPTNRFLSSSGGLLYEIAKSHLSDKGIFCGVRYNARLGIAEHYLANSKEHLDFSRGSKYIQSLTVKAFSLFNNTDHYLVVGTPCQIDGLRHYLKAMKREDNFLLIDFFCHGVPSYLMWHKYARENIENIDNIASLSFRNKLDGWHNSFRITAADKNGKTIKIADNGKMFYNFFFSHRCLNKACLYNCKYKYMNSVADIRAGDLWGDKYATDNFGTSGCVVFTEKGKAAIEKLTNCTFVEEDFETVAEGQMKKPPHKPLSFRYTERALKRGKSLAHIKSVASFLESIDPYQVRIKTVYYISRALTIFVRKKRLRHP